MIINARLRAPHLQTSTPSSLRNAALKIELRQEVHIAFMSNQPACLLVPYCDIDRTLNATDDWTWAWRMIAHCSDTLMYCNGAGPKTLERWQELWTYLEDWQHALPESFRPFWEQSADSAQGRWVPEVMFANDCHGMLLSC